MRPLDLLKLIVSLGVVSNENARVIPAILKIFRRSYILPEEGHENDPFFLIKFSLVILSMNFPCAGCLSHIIVNFQGGARAFDVVESFFICGITISIDVLWFYIVITRKHFLNAMKKLENFDYGIPKGYKKRNKLLYFLVHYICNYSLVVTVVFALIGSLFEKNCIARRTESNLKNICGMIMDTWAPFDIDYSPVKEIFFMIQVVTTGHLLYLGACTVFSASVYIELIVVKIEDFLDKLESVFEGRTDKERKRRLRFCVAYHKHLIELVRMLNSAYYVIPFLHYMSSSAIMAINIYAGLEEKENKYLFFLILLGTHVVLLTVLGQRLLNKGEKIIFALGQLKFYEGDVQLQKEILIMLRVSQKGLQFMTNGVAMSLERLRMVLQTTYSVVTVMWNLRHNAMR